MRGLRWFSGVAVLASFAGAAVAQPTLPQCYFWQEHPENDNNPWNSADFTTPDPTFAPFITVPLKYVGTPWSPTSAATYTMNRITRALLASPTWVNSTQSNIAVFLKDFGHVINTELPDPATGFFNEAWDTAQMGSLDPLDFPSQTGKVYLHPFLANATTGSNATLRGWMTEYVTSLAAQIATWNGNHNDPAEKLQPEHWQWSFDTETAIMSDSAGARDDVYMLSYLASQPDIWNTWKVPGSAGWKPSADHASNTNGKTLAYMYDDVKTAYAWPDDINDNTYGLDTTRRRVTCATAAS